MKRPRKPFQNISCAALPPMPLSYLNPKAARGCTRRVVHDGDHWNRVVSWPRDLRYPADFSSLIVRATGRRAKP